jgi:peptide/nickel transport system permease protein
MRISDVFLAIPTLLMALGVVALIGPSGPAVAVALSVAYSPTFARVLRGAVLNIRSSSYIEASHVIGASSLRVIISDVLPNVVPILVVQVTTALAWGILAEANIGFLGLGVQPPNPSWGSMLIEGRTYFYYAPWIPLFAGAAVLIAVLGFNLLGDGLRDLLDPRARPRW